MNTNQKPNLPADIKPSDEKNKSGAPGQAGKPADADSDPKKTEDK